MTVDAVPVARLAMASIAVSVAICGPQVSAANAAAAKACRSTSGLVSTLGLWDAYGSDIEDPVSGAVYGDVFGVGKGLGDRLDPVTLRGASRRGVPTRWALCADGRVLADLPVQRVRGARVLGLSVNGRRVAWRTSLPNGRGAIYVARIDGRRLRVERRATNRAIRTNREVNGRILVMPNGTTSWSLSDRGSGGVWLWPAGKPAKRVARVDTGDNDDQSWNVRIIDDGHVFVGTGERLASYGPTTPGRCPTPNGSRAVELSGSKLFVVDGGTLGADETSSWSWLLVCDRTAGRYLPSRQYDGGSARYNNSSYADPKVAYKTAGVVIAHELRTGNADGFIVQIPTTAIFSASPRRRFISGTPAGPGISALPPRSTGSSAGAPPVAEPTVRMLPGAVAWVEDQELPTGAVQRSDVWLADASGTRRIATIASTAQLQLPGPALGLQLTPTSVTWTAPSGSASAPVVPRPNDPIRTQELTAPR